MLELSAYFALVQIWSAISAAAILGVVNFVIAAILFVIAGRPPAGRELELANEIHGSAVDALQIEARAMQSHFTGMVQHPLNSVLRTGRARLRHPALGQNFTPSPTARRACRSFWCR